MKKVACYVRVSTESQIENYSIDEQIDRLNSYCKAKDYFIYNTYVDGGYSGGNTNRPGLQLMLTDAHKKKFEAVIVYKLDRLSRSQKDTLTLIEDEFLKNNLDFISVCENFDTTTPFGRAMIGILSVFAQLEKDQITERFTMGRIGRSKQGLFHGGGNSPKGYKYINGMLQVDEYEAIQVREIFDLFLSGMSINSIQKHMQGKYNNEIWKHAAKIYNVIKNPIYIGKIRFQNKSYEGQHTPIVENEIFYRANELLCSSERNKKTPQKTPFRAGYKLSSLIYCSHCGARYSANHGYYKCYSRSKSSKKFIINPECKNEHWVIQDLDNVVINEVLMLKQSGEIEKIFNNSDKKDNNTDFNLELIKINEQISKLVELYQISEIPIDTIKNKISNLNSKKTVIENKMNQKSNNNQKQNFITAIQAFEDILKSDNIDNIRMTLSILIERIEIDNDKVQIHWRVE